MDYLFYNYPKCSTCKNAKKFLDENSVKYIDINIVTDTPKYDELKEIIEKSNISINKFFNTSGMLYRSMNIKEKIKELSDDEKIKLLASNGMLIKRPLLVKKDQILLGFKVDEWNKIL